MHGFMIKLPHAKGHNHLEKFTVKDVETALSNKKHTQKKLKELISISTSQMVDMKY